MILSDILPKAANKWGKATAAIMVNGEKETFEGLFQKSKKLEVILATTLEGQTRLIASCLPKSFISLASIHAILQTGSAYIPLDPHGAGERNAWILQDCQPEAIITNLVWAAQLREILDCPIVQIPIQEEGLVLLIFRWEMPTPLAKDLAIILYTSGSTGQPKGVQISHQNAWAFISWASQTFDLPTGVVATSIAPFHFDLSVFDIYVSALKGMQLLLLDQKTCQNPYLLASLFDTYQVHTSYATPSLLVSMLRFGRMHKFKHQSIKQVLFAGEVFPVEQLRKLQQNWNQASFYNLYGPTETNVVSYYPIPNEISDERTTPFPIGKICFGSHAMIYDGQDIREFSAHEEGELVISGPTVTQGYVNDEEKNQDVFLFDKQGKRYYKTGDWVQLDKEGNFIFIGRKDRMVKRRGYRIELAELERSLLSHPGIEHTAVLSLQEEASIRIIAFICLEENHASSLDRIAINQFLLQCLPAYFLPDEIRTLDQLPLTSTQKIDYQKLKTTIISA